MHVKKVAILQSNYIPWKGYFDLLAFADEFIIYDDMQYTRRDWRNRNLIKTSQGLKWLTVPVQVKGKYDQKIRDTLIVNSDWAVSHWGSITHSYRRAPYFDEIAEWLEPIYLADKHSYISQLNCCLIKSICKYLDISTRITDSSDYFLVEGRTERLADLCKQVGATEYVSGPSAKDYIEASTFQDLGIALTWFEYPQYPEYPQLWGDFAHGVTILDLLFNCGKQSPNFMRCTT